MTVDQQTCLFVCFQKAAICNQPRHGQTNVANAGITRHSGTIIFMTGHVFTLEICEMYLMVVHGNGIIYLGNASM